MSIDEKEKKEIHEIAKEIDTNSKSDSKYFFFFGTSSTVELENNQGEKEKENICHRNYKYLKIWFSN